MPKICGDWVSRFDARSCGSVGAARAGGRVHVDRRIGVVDRVDVLPEAARVLCKGATVVGGPQREHEVLPHGERLHGSRTRAARSIDHDRAELLAQIGRRVGTTRREARQAQLLLDRRHVGRQVVGRGRVCADAGEVLGDEVLVEEEVEQLVVADHAAHRQGAVVEIRELLHRPPGHMPTHRHADQEDLAVTVGCRTVYPPANAAPRRGRGSRARRRARRSRCRSTTTPPTRTLRRSPSARNPNGGGSTVSTVPCPR